MTDHGVTTDQRVRSDEYLLAHAGVGQVVGGGAVSGQRAAVLSCAEAVPGPVAALLRLPMLAAPTALVEGATEGLCAQGTAPQPAGTLSWEADTPEHQRLVVDGPGGWLVIADLYTADWEAQVNGAPAQLLPANAAGRAVRVPAGRVTVDLDYRPTAPLHGALLAVCAVLGLAVGARRGL